MSQNCPYCNSFLAGKPRDLWDSVLYESENFVVTPTKGSILPGWLLVSPKKHILNMSKISHEQTSELNLIQKQAASFLEEKFGPVVLFEHGPNIDNGELGCGVNHAHLHIVSLPFSLNSAIQNFDLFSTEWIDISSKDYLSYLRNMDKQYLFYKDLDGSYKVSFINTGISQYFRKIISSKLGLPDLFDYKEHYFISNVESLLEQFAPTTANWNYPLSINHQEQPLFLT